MAARRESGEKPERSRRPPATTLQARERQVVAKAFDLAEEQIEKKTASSQVIAHFLKLGSSREFLEQERIRMETEFMQAKLDNMASAARVEELYGAAINAMRHYSGQAPLELPDDDED